MWCLFYLVPQSHSGLSESKETWGYVNVRNDAHLFWWLYYTTSTDGYKSRPLVIWLQVNLHCELENLFLSKTQNGKRDLIDG